MIGGEACGESEMVKYAAMLACKGYSEAEKIAKRGFVRETLITVAQVLQSYRYRLHTIDLLHGECFQQVSSFTITETVLRLVEELEQQIFELPPTSWSPESGILLNRYLNAPEVLTTNREGIFPFFKGRTSFVIE